MVNAVASRSLPSNPWYPETRSRFGSESYADRLNAGQAATLFGHRRVLSDQFDARP
ncbi:MAG: hypothetical protein ACJAYX_004916, partial [Planctomycetota bacterium]